MNPVGAGAGDTAANQGGEGESAGPTACDCPAPLQIDHFSAGMNALANGDDDEARTQFTLHAQTDEPFAGEEAEAGLVLLSLLVASHNASSSQQGGASPGTANRLTLLARVLNLITQLEQDRAELAAQNEALASDLEKREEALKRLRELTLGQPEA